MFLNKVFLAGQVHLVQFFFGIIFYGWHGQQQQQEQKQKQQQNMCKSIPVILFTQDAFKLEERELILPFIFVFK